MSPRLGITTERGLLRIAWIFWKGASRSAVQLIRSLPDLVAGICSSSSFVKEASLVPGRHTSLNLTDPSQLRRLLTVDGGLHTERGSNLCWIGESFPLSQLRPKMSACWMLSLSFDGFSGRSAASHLPRIDENRELLRVEFSHIRPVGESCVYRFWLGNLSWRIGQKLVQRVQAYH